MPPRPSPQNPAGDVVPGADGPVFVQSTGGAEMSFRKTGGVLPRGVASPLPPLPASDGLRTVAAVRRPIDASARGAVNREDAERDWLAALLWRAFPEAVSENHLSELAAQTLTADRRPVTARAVRNWLRRENTPHYRYVLWVIAMAGAERVFDFLEPDSVLVGRSAARQNRPHQNGHHQIGPGQNGQLDQQ